MYNVGAGAAAAEGKLPDVVSVDDFGAVPESEASAANNAVAFQKALDAAAASSKQVICGSGKTYWLPTQTFIGRSNVTLDGRGATLKQASGHQTLNWLLVTKCNGFSIKNFVIDGNRAGAASLGRDASLLVIFSTENIEISGIIIHSSAAKGLAITSATSGTGTRNIKVIDVTAYNCKYQAVMTDRSNGGNQLPACEDVSFDRIIVRDTDHAGIAVNDGSRRIAVSNCVLDVNNSVWDALAIRGSRDVVVSNTVGRRGRNGCGISVLDAGALMRGEDTQDITLSNNIWETNKQNGCLITGAVRVTVNGDIARNNGQAIVGASGFNISQVAGVRRSKYITLNSVVASDNQPAATQATGISVSATDDIRIESPVMHGNSINNKVILSSVTKPVMLNINQN